MSIPLRLSTAGQIVALGQFLDPASLGSTKDALTIANTDVKLLKWGSSSLASKNSGGATFIVNGVYYTTLDATDTNTVGHLTIFCTMAGAVPVRLECHVYPTMIYDSLFAAAGTDYLQTDVIQVGSSTTAGTRQSNLLINGILTSTVAASPAPTTTTFAGGLTGGSYPDNCFRNAAIVFTSGSNAGMTPRVVTSFVSSTGLFTTATAMAFTPSAGDTFQIVGVAV